MLALRGARTLVSGGEAIVKAVMTTRRGARTLVSGARTNNSEQPLRRNQGSKSLSKQNLEP